MKTRWLTCAAVLWLGAATGAMVPAQQPFTWALPSGFPAPMVPADNPISEAKVELGRHLFYDTRLSANGTQSCGTCHEQARAFTDGKARSIGSAGEVHPRSSMSLVNVAYAAALTWSDPTQVRLEDQALVPMYGEHPVELGLDRSDSWLTALRADRRYQELFRAAFGADAAITRDNVVKGIASFQRAIVSARSPYDRYHFDRDDSAISPAARRGEVVFHSRPLSCFTCHGGVHFSNAMGSTPRTTPIEFHNTGLYNLAAPLSYPAPNVGVFEITRRAEDVGKFKVPTLRNIAVTAPYMHDGSVATLEDAIDHYAAGGRTITAGLYQGVGSSNPNKTASIRGFTLTPEQRSDLIAFLQSLTDQAVLTDARFANPWPSGRGHRTNQPMRPVLSRALCGLVVAAALAADLGAQRGPTIAAASNLNFALAEIAKQFEQDRSERVELVFGASGALTRQIRDGAPFEMFLAADEEFPDQLSAAGLTRDPGVVYAVGRLVVFAPNGSPLTVDERLDGLARLVKSGQARRFAIANPEVAPYGRAAEAVLRKRGLWEPLRANLVFGDNISQAAQFATTGNAVGGIIAYSLVLSPEFGNRGTYVLLPDADHPPLRQRMVLLKRAGAIAEHFYQYLQGPVARGLLRKHGFAVPQ